MKHLFITTALAVSVAATVAFAQNVQPLQGQATNPLVERIVSQYQSEGFTRLEVDTGPRQIKVEALRDGRELEVVYDAATGEILFQKWGVERDADDSRPGVFYDRDDDDWVDAQGRYIDDRDDRDDRGPRPARGDDRDDDWDDRWDDDRDDRDDDWDDRWDDDRMTTVTMIATTIGTTAMMTTTVTTMTIATTTAMTIDKRIVTGV